MRVAARTFDRDADLAEAAILSLIHVLFKYRLVEARPACAGLEFRLGLEQCQSARGTIIDAVFMLVGKLAGIGAFSALFTHNGELDRREHFLPVFLGFDNFLAVVLAVEKIDLAV